MTKYSFLLLAAMAMADTVPAPDENLRVAALHAIFPGMQISLDAGKRIDDSWPEEPRPAQLDSPDALAKENVYRVIGGATNKAEKQASDQLITGKPSNTRLVRFQIFHWPDSSDLLAVLQYKFEDAVPSMACPSIGLLVHLANVAGNWEVRDRYLLETMHHFTLQTIRMLNLTGEGADRLVIESDFGGAETWGTNIVIFNLGSKIEQVFETTSQIYNMTDDMFTQVIDIPRTVELHGEQVCFTKTTIYEDGKVFKPVRVTLPCYIPDDDINRKESEERSELLAPILRP
ncbi:MAG: hypothetical protein ABSF22_14375 [Bryobacteraceae bacterium]